MVHLTSPSMKTQLYLQLLATLSLAAGFSGQDRDRRLGWPNPFRRVPNFGKQGCMLLSALLLLAVGRSSLLQLSAQQIELSVISGQPHIVLPKIGESFTVLERSYDLHSWEELIIVDSTALPYGYIDTEVSLVRAVFYRARFPEGQIQEPCGIMMAAEPFLLEVAENSEGTECPTLGAPDSPEVRDAAIPSAETPIKTIRMRLHILANDDGSNPAATEADIGALVLKLNETFAPQRLAFRASWRIIPSTELREIDPDFESKTLKDTLAEAPERQLNVYVTKILPDWLGRQFAGWGTFPWKPESTGPAGGIVLDSTVSVPSSTTLQHEVGHCLGLYHSFHGATLLELLPEPECSACWERADRVNADRTGDFCSDTPIAPLHYDCDWPFGVDTCSGVQWGDDSDNLMSYASMCRRSFTSQQAGRMHAWIEERLSGWVEEASNPAILLAPMGVAYRVRSGCAVEISWEDQNISETGFDIERSRDRRNYKRILEVPPIGEGRVTTTDVGLQDRSNYWYRVRARRGEVASSWTVVGPVPVKCSGQVRAPGPLRVSLTRRGYVRLTWGDNSLDETGFEIHRAIGNGTYTRLARTESKSERASRFVDSSASGGTTYRYKVRALRGQSVSAFSSEAVIAANPRDEVLFPCGGVAVDRALCFRWQPVPGAGAYTFEIADEPNDGAIIGRRTAVLPGDRGEHCILADDPLKGPARPELEHRKFYWRLRTDDGTSGAWCEIRTQPLGTPAAECSPGNPVLSRTPAFSWAAVPWAQRYRFRLSVDSPGNLVPDREKTETGTSHLIQSELRPNRQFYWQVRAERVDANNNTEEEGQWTDWCAFRTSN